jgi:imidazolonepropionase-like amidohydrolase
MSLVLIGASLIDGSGGDPLPNATVVVDGPLIREVAAGGQPTTAPAGATVVDCSGMTIMPGMVDCHFHGIYRNASCHEDYDFRLPLEESVLTAAENARRILQAGFTTARDVGTRSLVAVTIRDAIARGVLLGPTLKAGGQIITSTGGLSDHYGHWGCNAHALGRLADGPQEMIKAVREQVKYRVDNVKLEASGTGISTYSSSTKQTTPEEDLRAGCWEAHRNGVRVACHAQGRDSIKNAVRAGVDTIEHGTFLDEEAVSLMLERGTVLVPTLSVFELYVRRGPDVGVPDWVVEKFRGDLMAHMAGFRLAHESGVPIAVGGDAGHSFNPQEDVAYELELMTQHGMSPMEAIVAATANGARAVGRAGETGEVLAGMAADLLVIDGDPLEDIRILQDPDRLSHIFKNGRLVAGMAAAVEPALV